MSVQFQNLTHDELFLINILNTMYNDNNRQIQQLNDSNNEIKNTITRLLLLNNSQRSRNRANTNTRQRVNSRNNIYNEVNTEINHEVNSGMNANNNVHINTIPNRQRRLYINQRPYIIENIRHFTAPINMEHEYLEDTTQRTRTMMDTHNTFLQNFLNPIEVFPTESQIENATRIVRYCDIVRPNNTSCPISLEPFRENDYVSVIRYCNHIFNTRELNSWFMRNCRCPVCRYDIRNYNPSLNNTIHHDSLQNINEPSERQSEQPSEQRNNTINEIRNNPLFNFLTNYDTNTELNANDLINETINSLISIAGLTDVSGNYYFDISGNTIDISGNFFY